MSVALEQKEQAQNLKQLALAAIQKQADAIGWKNKNGRGVAITSKDGVSRTVAFEHKDGSLSITNFDNKVADELYERGEQQSVVEEKAATTLLKTSTDGQVQIFANRDRNKIEHAAQELQAIELGETTASRQSREEKLPSATPVQIKQTKPPLFQANSEQTIQPQASRVSDSPGGKPKTRKAQAGHLSQVKIPDNSVQSKKVPQPVQEDTARAGDQDDYWSTNSTRSNSARADYPQTPKEKTTVAAESLPKSSEPSTTEQFFQPLLKQLREQQLLKDVPAKLEVKVGDEVAYRRIEGQKPEVNRIDQETLAYLAKAIRQPQVQPGQLHQTDSSLNRSVSIKVNNEVVFQLRQGVVEVNKLEPILAQEIAKAVQQVILEVTPEYPHSSRATITHPQSPLSSGPLQPNPTSIPQHETGGCSHKRFIARCCYRTGN